MKILFISSGNSSNGLSNIVKNQGDSIIQTGQQIDYLTIKGKGIFGYLRNIPRIRYKLANENYDIIHAHYALSAFVSTLAGSRPLIVSVMGSDTKISLLINFLIRIFQKHFWAVVILKSKELNNELRLKDFRIIPNGVDTERFLILNQKDSRKKIGWKQDKFHILFPSNPERFEKNYSLAERAIKIINSDLDVELHYIKNIPNSEMPYYYNASSMILITSLWEGSPNAIKEAMSCNCPIVSTNVGDVKWVFGDTEGCFLTSFEPEDVAEKVHSVLSLSRRTKGRQRILNLGLDSKTIANKLILVYKEVVEKNRQ